MRFHFALVVSISLLAAASGDGRAAAQQAVQAVSPALRDLRAAAEAIDPLAKAAESEAAWQAYLSALEAANGSVADQALALNRIGDSRYYQQKGAAALAAALEAKRRLEAAGETGGEPMAETLANVATFYGVTGAPEQELPLQEQALAIRQRLYGKDPLAVAPDAAKALGLGYLNYANALYVRGRLNEAADLVKPSIDGLVAGGLQDATLFVAMSSGANMLADAGRAEAALELAQDGVATAARLLPEGHPFIGFAQGTLAKVLLQSDRFAEAEAPARRAVDIMAEKLGPRHPNTLSALQNLAVILGRLGKFEEAITLSNAVAERSADADPGETVVMLSNASGFAHEAGDDAAAMRLARRAADLAATLAPDNRKAIKGMTALALRQDEAREYVAARASLDAVAGRRQVISDTAPDPVLDIQRGLMEIRTGDGAKGWSRVKTGRAGLEQAMLDAADTFELGADLASYYDPVLQLVEAAFAADRPGDALRAFELASWGVNARNQQFATLRAHVAGAPALMQRIDALKDGRTRLRALHKERAALLAADQPDLAAERAGEIERLTASVATLESGLARDIPDFGARLRPQMLSLPQMQARLGRDDAVLMVMPGRSRTFTMVVTATQTVMAESASGRPQVRSLVAQLRAALDAPGGDSVFPTAQAKQLHDIVLPGSAAAALAGHRRVRLVTSDALSRLPFGVLLASAPEAGSTDYRSMDWLIRRHGFSIALTPSAAFDAPGAGGIQPSLFAVGAPSLHGTARGAARIAVGRVYRGSEVDVDDLLALPALPATKSEIASVAEAFGAGRTNILTGDDATEARVRAASGNSYGVWLFATHGLLDGEIGGLREPALVLTPGGVRGDTMEDGLLQASEIAALNIRADLVILSACNSAAGRDETAPVYTGLANAFLASGSRSLILSHWRVRDDAAAYLSVATVERAISGTPAAEALREAQLDLILGKARLEGSSNPSVWAPFVFIGASSR